jgi:hypothetical protein
MDEKPNEINVLSKGQQGAVLVIVVASLVVIIGVAALAIDIGYLYTTRNELQNVADAAALAGARYLGEIYSGLPISAMGVHSFTKPEVMVPINAIAQKNKAGNDVILIRPEDVDIGLWDPAKSQDDIYLSTLMGPDAVTVIARRDNTANNPITVFFAKIFGIDSMNVVSRKAIAALTGPSFVKEEDLTTPFGISQNKNCADPIIKLSPTGSCAGWHDFIWPHNENDMATTQLRIINDHVTDVSGMVNGHDWLTNNWPTLKWSQLNSKISSLLNIAAVPDIFQVGDYFDFNGGNVSSLFNGSYIDTSKTYDGNQGTITGSPANSPAPIFALFDYFRFRDHDGHNDIWTATIPVYKDTFPCANPSGSTEIVGYADVQITSPLGPPSTSFDVTLDCNLVVDPDRGGGTTYGNLKGKIPNLVK